MIYDEFSKVAKGKSSIEYSFMLKDRHKHYFYGKPVISRKEQEYIQNFLKKYKDEPVSDILHQKIWDELQMEKHLGNITIPFKVVARKDPSGLFPEYIEVILDTKL